MRLATRLILGFAFIGASHWIFAGTSWSATQSPLPLPSASSSSSGPKIQSLLKPKIYDRVLKDREIMTHASLDSVDDTSRGQVAKGQDLREYSYYATMLVHASVKKTHDTLTDYHLYAKLIPYVDTANYNAQTHVLEIEGGILGWTLHSWVHFEEVNDHWIRFQFVAGHFQGMTGDILFEPRDENGTLVYFGGHQILSQWPPKLVMEKGAEIVFGFTAGRMRSYIESKSIIKESQENDGFPQPRTHFEKTP
jgi:hypothetical protein